MTAVPGTVDRARLGFKSRDNVNKDSGDWGINVQYYIEPLGLDAAFIYMNNTDRLINGLFTSSGDVTSDEAAQARETNAVLLGHYGWAFKDDIDTFGIALSKEMFDISWGMDLVYRRDTGLSPDLLASLAPVSGPVDGGNNYPGATGDTMHVVVNGVGFLNGEWGLWQGGSYVVEATFSKVDSFGDNEEKASVFIHEDRWNSHIAAVFRPTWYQVFPGWDLTVPMSVSYQIDGEQSPSSSGGTEEVGNGSIGVKFLVNEVWDLTAQYNVYFGPQGNGSEAFIKDRDNIALTVKRTF